VTSPAKIITVTQSQKVSIGASLPFDRHNFRTTALLRWAVPALLLALAACSEAVPQGQVIAVVDGTEITLAELNEEGRSRGIDIANDRANRDALLRELVERKLLVREAEARELDRSPDFLLAERRSREILLGQQLLAKAARDQGAVTDDDLRRFIAARPLAFPGRQSIRVEVAALPATLPAPLRQALARSPDRATMERLLGTAGVKARWSEESWDSAAPPPGLQGWPQGDAFLLERNGALVAGRVLARQAQPVPAEQQLPLARAMIAQERAEQALVAIVGKARESASIRYQPAYAPR
jgi:EpsD family peptidyl-prolyl cis-trans isomerase